tara:strand:- start:530 stop:1105 length:576 start_codon:yes stop_codon:yes gene_type:complete
MRPVLLDIVESLGHTIFESGVYNLNIIGIRSTVHHPNQFDDRMCLVFRDEIGWLTRTWPCTTDPGKYWLEHPMNIEGTAILVPGQYRGVYRIGKHRGQYDALTQRGGTVKVYRDGDKDEILDMDPESVTEGYYGINIHKAGAKSIAVNRWSAGCQVFANKDDFVEFMSICYAARNKWGDSFTYTLIEDPEM